MVTVERVRIDPDTAELLLSKNLGNRPINIQRVAKLAEEMAAGRWVFNGDAIRFNGNGLVDGQHRLKAVIKSGVSIDTLLVEGLDHNVFPTIDTGKPRSAADTLATAGESRCKSTAATLKLVDRYLT